MEIVKKQSNKLLGFSGMLRNIPESAKNLASVRGLAMSGMLVALCIVLGYIKIPLSADNRISFGFIATSTAGFILGPVPAAVVALVADVLGYIINPSGGAFFPPFTLSTGLAGFIYGLFLYRQPLKRLWLMSIISVAIITLFINIILNTYFLSILYQKSMQIFKYARIIKNVIQYPVHVVVISLITSVLEQRGIRKIFNK